MLGRLQKHNFQWEDEPYEILIKKYPKCTSALRWWCNAWGDNSRFNISRNKFLKEFIIFSPPTFKISNKCCYYAKKKVALDAITELNADLNVMGVRKAEGGARATAYKNCFSVANNGHIDNYRPIFFYTNKDKQDYEKLYQVKHSDCYNIYGLKRTGCCGCPYGRDFEYELEIIAKYEPKLYKACNNIFGESYAYTRAYRDFVKQIDK